MRKIAIILSVIGFFSIGMGKIDLGILLEREFLT